jgi:hypothetical protein
VNHFDRGGFCCRDEFQSPPRHIPAVHDFTVKLMQLGASLSREELCRIVNIEPLLDVMTGILMVGAVG